MDSRPIGIFDSGVGGLTVAREIIDLLPNESIIYFGDTLRCPYGPRDLNEVRGFVFEIVEYLRREGVKLVVVACNTGTAAGLVEAQSRFDLPLVGVIEPGAHAAVRATRNRKVGVIGTAGTVSSQAYDRMIKTLDAGIEVYSQACPPFAEFVENGKVTGNEVREVVTEYLQPLKEAGVDTLILGCTHYPLLSGVIAETMGEGVEIISSAKETAEEVKAILERKGQLRIEPVVSVRRFLTTGEVSHFLTLGKRFLGQEIEQAEHVVIGPGASKVLSQEER